MHTVKHKMHMVKCDVQGIIYYSILASNNKDRQCNIKNTGKPACLHFRNILKFVFEGLAV